MDIDGSDTLSRPLELWVYSKVSWTLSYHVGRVLLMVHGLQPSGNPRGWYLRVQGEALWLADHPILREYLQLASVTTLRYWDYGITNWEQAFVLQGIPLPPNGYRLILRCFSVASCCRLPELICPLEHLSSRRLQPCYDYLAIYNTIIVDQVDPLEPAPTNVPINGSAWARTDIDTTGACHFCNATAQSDSFCSDTTNGSIFTSVRLTQRPLRIFVYAQVREH